MSVPNQTPQEQADRLLGRALNSFELPDELFPLLETALAHDAALHSAQHSAGLHREIHRHTWLLADGSALVLWELVHNATARREEQHELYTEAEEVHTAAARLPFPADPQPRREATEAVDLTHADEPLLLETVLMIAPTPRRAYGHFAQEDAADHARRLLRRAENADRPDERTARLLRTAVAHQITQAFGRPGRTEAGFTLYEHAFLLADGQELSLWEVEHTDSPDGRHVCEVYEEEGRARAVMEGRGAAL
ncbi:DUF6227 family protein [Streptomyces indicus]|uniref:Uncharacterized protein n=1 Tax=Streptomyces indicus TaxID=417292 RepID=A0A1G9H0S8_9ACTN|nr:DUF6227 family protein [Streptomyces indicus]SDL06454.1 hypothetical protein SAMN05421806_117131 [Streptomyces indicus]